MKRLFLLFFFSYSLALCAQDTVWNCRCFGGVNFLKTKKSFSSYLTPQSGYVFGVGIGRKKDKFTSEVEVSYRYNEGNPKGPYEINRLTWGGNFQKISSFLNGYVEWPLCKKAPYFRPYIGGGVGYRIDKEIMYIDAYQTNGKFQSFRTLYKWWGFSGQIITGAALHLNKNLAAQLEYRFLKDDKYFCHNSAVFNFNYHF